MSPVVHSTNTVPPDVTLLQDGDQVVAPFLLRAKESRSTQAGKPFFAMTFVNELGQEITGNAWSNQVEAWTGIEPGAAVLLTASIELYKGAKQLKFTMSPEVLPTPQPVQKWMNKIYPGDLAQLEAEFRAARTRIQDPGLQLLLERFFATDGLEARFFLAPGAKGNHHAYLHGLPEHTLELDAVAEASVLPTPQEAPAVVQRLAASLTHPGYRRFVELVLAAAGPTDDLAAAPGAATGAFARKGGLLQLTAATAHTIDAASRLPGLQGVFHRDLALAGAIIHDLGKRRTLSLTPDGAVEQTAMARLTGSVTEGSRLLRDVYRAHQDELTRLGLDALAFDELLHAQIGAYNSQAEGAVTPAAMLESKAIAVARATAFQMETIRQAVDGKIPDAAGFVADAGPAFPNGVLLTPAGAQRLRDRNGTPGIAFEELLDRDVVRTGILLHDVGKVQEYVFEGEPINVSPSSLLYGHLTSGPLLLDDTRARYADELAAAGLDPKAYEHVQHLIVSHHGQLAWGSAVTPASPEAVIAHGADMFSAHTRKIEAILREQTPDRHGVIKQAGPHYRSGVRAARAILAPQGATVAVPPQAERLEQIVLEATPAPAAANDAPEEADDALLHSMPGLFDAHLPGSDVIPTATAEPTRARPVRRPQRS